MRAVRLGRPHRDVEHLRDLLIRVTEREQAQDLPLAVRERIRLGKLRRLGVGRHQPRTEFGVHVPAAARDLANRRHDLGVRCLLQDVAAGARRKGLADIARLVLHREDEHLSIRVLVLELRERLQAGLVRHDDVEQDHVGLQGPGLEDGVAGIAGLAHRLEVVRRLEQQPQAAAHHRVVVDDEHPDAHETGTSATTVVPAPGRDSISSLPSISASRSRMPRRPTPSSGTVALVEPGSVVLDHRGDAGCAAGERDADVLRVRVLDDVGERLLHDSVERSLHVAGQSRLSERGVEVDPNVRLFSERLGQPLERRYEPEVVEHRRAQLYGQAAHVLERAHDVLPQLGERRARRVVGQRFLERFQPQQDGGERLAGLVVELAGQPASLQLLRLHHPADGVPRDALRQLDRDGRPRRERLGEPKVVVREARVGADLVVDLEHADRLVAGDERHPHPRQSADPSRDFLVHLGIVDHRIDALAAPPLEHRAALRSGPREGRPHEAFGACRCGKTHLGAAGGQRQRNHACLEDLAQAADDQVEQLVEIGFRRERVPTSFSDWSWRDQRVDASYSRAFSIATAAWPARSLTSSVSSSEKSSPPSSR